MSYNDIIDKSTSIYKISDNSVSDAVMLSPSEIAEAHIGESLVFTCSVTGIILEWSFSLLSEPQPLISYLIYTFAIIAEGPAEAQTFQWVDNSTIYQFTRTSAEGSPVSSRLIISAVSTSHNGIKMNCSDVSSTETASTTIVVHSIDNQSQGMYIIY